ncbi:MAG: RDD family protein [Deltaproteobacteria bacterium]|nr:RDD family protein [Deltaproteobacteria bacterium]
MKNNRENTLIIETPEGIEFSLRLAGPVIRCLAWTVDLACIAALAQILRSLMRVFSIISEDFAAAGFIILYLAVSIGYGIVMEYYWRGQTIGKRMFNLRVMDIQGLNLQLHQVIIRNILRPVDKLPSVFYMVGGLTCLFSRYSQRLGDIAANTIVVWNHGMNEPDLDQLLPDKYNSFRDYPHLVGRLRQGATPREAGIALQALVRRDQFDLSARIELFGEITARFKKIVEFPHEATEGISDEQYIRNVVDVLFRTNTGKI